MPVHEYRCSKCEVITEVVRTLKGDDYKRKPRGKERGCQCKSPKYIKILTKAPDEAYGDSWGGGSMKGRW